MKNKDHGFTLVELMVAVAIIGLLSAVAVPNFKKYQARAKVIEAKLQLSAVYIAQPSFFSDFNMYGTCLRYMGYDPSAEMANRYYAVGFWSTFDARNPQAETSAVTSGLKLSDCPNNDSTAGDDTTLAASWYVAGKGIGPEIAGQTWDLLDNASGNVITPCTASDIAAAAGGICVGTQADASTTVYSVSASVSAVGVISANATDGASASGLNIDNEPKN